MSQRTYTLPEHVDRMLSCCIDSEGCWLYQGKLTHEGYVVKSMFRVQYKGHRMVYEYMRADIPTGLVVDHLCRNRNCLNPWHMEPVPNGINVGRGMKLNAMKTHCPAGHEYDAKNTYVELTGSRKCRACGAERARRKRAVRSSGRR